MSTDPTMGPVQENDTSTSVRAMKKMPASPFESAFASVLLTIHEGMVISNAPKNEAAKTMNTRKKRMFGSQCVASQLNMSAVTASPPRMRVTRMIAAMGERVEGHDEESVHGGAGNGPAPGFRNLS